MPFTAPTLSAMVDDLARSLGDPAKVFWVQDELERYCREALRTWNAFANYWRTRRQFATTANNHYYNLTTLGLLSQPADQLPLLNDLQYALVEPFSTPAPPYDSFPTTEQYNSAQINAAILQALKQFQFDAGMTLTVEPVVTVPTNPDYQAELDENVCEVRHVELRIDAPGDPLHNRRAHLRRIDEADVQNYSTNDFIDPQVPYGYSFASFTQQMPTIRIFPPSSITGELQIVSIRANSTPPTDLQWPAKWLALHFLLTMDGQSRDHDRAQYCRKRYADSLILSRLVPSYGVGYINQRVAPIVAASDMDSHEPGWRNVSLAAGQEPTTIIDYGWNVIGVHPTPSSASPIHSISFDMFVEAPVAADPIQIAPEHLQAVLDYAKHIAIFKLGGAEFSATTPLMERFVMEAIEYNSKLAVEAKNLWTMKDRAARDKEQRYQRRPDPASSEIAALEGGR